jgi:nitroreductase
MPDSIMHSVRPPDPAARLHRSVRAYAPTALPDGTLEALIAAGQSAATSSNLQTWSVVAIQDEARKSRLADFAGGQRHIRQAPLFLVFLADLSRAARIGEAAGQSMEALPFLETFLVAIIDAAMAAQNATAAAESLGLGTVYIGAIRNHPEKVAAELQLPARVMPVFGLCVGYPDPNALAATVKPRLPQPAILHHEIYQAATETGLLPGYDATLRAFQATQSMPSQGWTDLIRSRLGAVKSLTGRDRLSAALHTLGFELR